MNFCIGWKYRIIIYYNVTLHLVASGLLSVSGCGDVTGVFIMAGGVIIPSAPCSLAHPLWLHLLTRFRFLLLLAKVCESKR